MKFFLILVVFPLLWVCASALSFLEFNGLKSGLCPAKFKAGRRLDMGAVSHLFLTHTPFH